MSRGITYAEFAALVAKLGSFHVEPRSRWGRSKYWRAAKRAERHGLVRIDRQGINKAIVYPIDRSQP